ncbi:hypothetical protein UPYG_G00160170 [Umbra pygmaea]|uniref:Alsin n=1 Tax=Umbra pygmaea TaxID=75934 RepID=A0ABD0XF24_UMBPY
MEDQTSSKESSKDRGLLHFWRGYSSIVAPERVLLARPVLQAALGISHGILLAEGGLVFCFGELPWRQGLTVPPTDPLLEPTLSAHIIGSVAAGSFHCSAVTQDGAVYMWGDNSSGQCGQGDRGLVQEPSLVNMLDCDTAPPQAIKVLQVSCGEHHTLALSARHEVWAWGTGCQLGLVTSVFPVWRPQKVEHLAGRHVVQVACGGFHSLALVRRVPQQEASSQMTGPGICDDCNQVPLSVVEERDKVIDSDSHYCPLGVQLAHVNLGKARHSSPVSQSSPVRQSSPCQRLRSSAFPLSQASSSSLDFDPGLVSQSHLSMCPEVLLAGDTDPPSKVSDTESTVSPGSERDTTTSPHLRLRRSISLVPAGRCLVSKRDSSNDAISLRRRTKSSPYPGEDDLKEYLKRRSAHTLSLIQQNHNKLKHDTSSTANHAEEDQLPITSHGSGDPLTLSNLIAGQSLDCGLSERDQYHDLSLDPQTQLADDSMSSIASSLSSSLSENFTDISVMEQAFAMMDGAASPLQVNTLVNTGSTSSLCESSKSEGCVPADWPRKDRPGPVMDSWKAKQEACLFDSYRGEKLSNLTDFLLDEVTMEARRHSLPPPYTHASPVLPSRRVIRRRPAPITRRKEAAEALPSLDTEVWSWGRGQEGQLGHGDKLPRLQPLCIDSLTGQEVVKLEAGTKHSLAVTAECQVFSWGSNKSGQLGHMNIPTTLPHLVKGLEGMRVWDVAAGQSHTVFLADGDRCQPILCYSGYQVVETSPEQHIPGTHSTQSAPSTIESYTIKPVLLPFCMDMGYISTVSGGGESSVALADHNVMGFIAGLHELAAADRKFFCRLKDIHRRVVGPLVKKEGLLGKSSSLLFQTLVGSYSRLCHLTGQHSVSLTDVIYSKRDIKGLFLLKHARTFQDTYKEYCSSVGNFLVMGGFQALMKHSLECFGKKFEVVHQLSDSYEDKGSFADQLVALFYTPVQHLHVYNKLLLKLATCFDVNAVEYQKLQEGCATYEALSVSLGKKRKVAESTNQFWRTHSGKTINILRRPHRRLLCESSDKSLTLQNAGRFSINWFILFNDVLIHAQFSSHHVFPLATLWVEPITEETSNSLFGIKVTTPEESFTLLAPSPQEKAKWLRAMNQAVEAVLTREESGAGVPADSRTASYVFSKDLNLKDVSYSGRWLSGKPHGKYATGEVYEGCFHENMRQGHGMLSSGKLIGSSSSVFIGQWLQDKKTGYGVFDDMTRGEKYMGLWLDDQRHGNGVLIKQSGLYYEGAFSNNKMMGTGLLVSDDDTFFTGEFSDDWTPNGKGTLSMPNGDFIEGMFSGEWTSGLKVIGTYMKCNLYNARKKEQTWVWEVGRLSVPAEQKWTAVFSECWSLLGCEAPGQPGQRRKAWENIAVTLTAGRRDSPELVSRSQSRVLEKLEVIPQHTGMLTSESYDIIRRYLTKACETPLHPLGWLVETLVTVYRMTYVGVGSNRLLLPQAVEEIRSFVRRIFRLVRFLFPDLPEEGTFILSDLNTSPETNQQGWVVSSSTLVLPVLLPRLYPPLFSLYTLDKEPEERLYWDAVLRLNKHPDRPLLELLGVQQKFWPVTISVLGEKEEVLPTTKDACFASAVETLQLISTTFTPSDKLQVIQRTFEELTQEVQALFHEKVLWSMDDLFPLFLYVVLRARVRRLGSEVNLIEDLMDPSLQHGELGLMFTTLKACYFQIQQENLL